MRVGEMRVGKMSLNLCQCVVQLSFVVDANPLSTERA